MPYIHTLAFTLASTFAAIVTLPAYAQDQPADPYRDTVTIGVGVAALPDYEGSNDYLRQGCCADARCCSPYAMPQ